MNVKLLSFVLLTLFKTNWVISQTTLTTELPTAHGGNDTTETAVTTEMSTIHSSTGTTETSVITTHSDNETTENTPTSEPSTAHSSTAHSDSSTTEIPNTTGSATSQSATSTTEMQTTAPTTASPNPDQHNTINFNTSCVMLVGDIQWTIPYKDTSGISRTTVIGIQQSAVSDVNGTCGNETVGDVLNIWLYNNTWCMSINFGGNSDNIWWNEVSLHYVDDARFFTNYTGNNSVSYSYPFSNGFKAPRGGSYLCKADTSTDLSDGYKLRTWNLQYTAFQTNVTQFTGDQTECDADKSTSSIVPIAVGAALAALVVIVLIAYLIGRRRNRKGYESV